MMDKRTYKVIERGAHYEIPTYKVGEQGLEPNEEPLVVKFIRGFKLKVTEEEFNEAKQYLDSIAEGEEKTINLDTVEDKEKVEDCLTKVKAYMHPSQPGVLHETLMSMMIEDLSYKNQEYPSFETTQAITNLMQALHWLNERQYQRVKRGILNMPK